MTTTVKEHHRTSSQNYHHALGQFVTFECAGDTIVLARPEDIVWIEQTGVQSPRVHFRDGHYVVVVESMEEILKDIGEMADAAGA
jgi:hypothetical protein